MPFSVRAILFVLQAMSLVGFFLRVVPFLAVPVLASPLPMLMTRMAISYARSNQPSEPVLAYAFHARDAYIYPEDSANPHTIVRRDIDTFLGNINILNTYINQMNDHNANFQTLLGQASSSPNNPSYREQAATEMSGFHSNLLGIEDILRQLGADKGLANYDKTNDLETLLKNIVNANKDLLSNVDTLVYEIPGVGPTLGPIVYEIKCILDEVLDAVENLTDGLLNDLQPLLQNLIGQTSQTACGLGIVGLCLLP